MNHIVQLFPLTKLGPHLHSASDSVVAAPRDLVTSAREMSAEKCLLEFLTRTSFREPFESAVALISLIFDLVKRKLFPE